MPVRADVIVRITKPGYDAAESVEPESSWVLRRKYFDVHSRVRRPHEVHSGAWEGMDRRAVHSAAPGHFAEHCTVGSSARGLRLPPSKNRTSRGLS
jgi:hypothetical protein